MTYHSGVTYLSITCLICLESENEAILDCNGYYTHDISVTGNSRGVVTNGSG